jgi:hypothetical protein
MFALIAFVLFILTAFDVDLFDKINEGYLGLAFLALALLLGDWPIGLIRSRNSA